MVDVRSVPASDLDEFRRLHNQYVDRDESPETVRGWHREHPDLLVGAYRDGELVGHCLGRPRTEESVELAGIAVEAAHQRRGVGTALLAAFEDRAAALGFRRVSLGSAGGYVDEFYVDRGYSPTSVLVRLDPADASADYRTTGYDVVEETEEDGVRKLYVGVDGFDPAFLEAVREAFDDPEAVFVMEKDLDPRS